MGTPLSVTLGPDGLLPFSWVHAVLGWAARCGRGGDVRKHAARLWVTVMSGDAALILSLTI